MSVMERNNFTYDDLIDCGHGKLFGEGNAQLPLPPMLMFDRITQISEDGGEFGKGEVVAEFDIKPDLWFFPCHFEGDPVMPGCLVARKEQRPHGRRVPADSPGWRVAKRTYLSRREKLSASKCQLQNVNMPRQDRPFLS